jgi:hypothetical protein
MGDELAAGVLPERLVVDPQPPDDPVEQDHEEVEPVEGVADLGSRPVEGLRPAGIRRRDDAEAVATLLRTQVAPHDAALARLDRERVLLEDRDVVVGRPREQADESPEAALGVIEEQDVAGFRAFELFERVRGRG